MKVKGNQGGESVLASKESEQEPGESILIMKSYMHWVPHFSNQSINNQASLLRGFSAMVA